MTNKLFSTPPEEYGDRYRDHAFEQYTMFVGSAERTSERRLDAHKYFATINAAILTAIGLTLQFGNYESRMWTRLALAIAGIGVAIVYWLLIRSYKNLNSAKFNIIHRIEEKLPFALYATEWDALGNGADKKKHLPFSHVESWIPVAFLVGYLALLVWCVRWFIG